MPSGGRREVIEVQVAEGRFQEAPVELLRTAVRTVLEAESVEEGEVSMTLLGDGDMRALNRTHLGRDRVTDVLAFALWDEGEPVVGDVYVGHEQALRQAREAGVPPDEELVRLAVHGTLHVLGWEHPEDRDARAGSEMYRRQEELVERLTTA